MKTQKEYTSAQIEMALTLKGFTCTGGEEGLVQAEGEAYYEDGTISTQWTFCHPNGHTTVHATVEGGVINGEHPTTWFETNSSDIVVTKKETKFVAILEDVEFDPMEGTEVQVWHVDLREEADETEEGLYASKFYSYRAAQDYGWDLEAKYGAFDVTDI
jgi:hypothetical protein